MTDELIYRVPAFKEEKVEPCTSVAFRFSRVVYEEL